MCGRAWRQQQGGYRRLQGTTCLAMLPHPGLPHFGVDHLANDVLFGCVVHNVMRTCSSITVHNARNQGFPTTQSCSVHATASLGVQHRSPQLASVFVCVFVPLPICCRSLGTRPGAQSAAPRPQPTRANPCGQPPLLPASTAQRPPARSSPSCLLATAPP
jgi:hypothetical protein